MHQPAAEAIVMDGVTKRFDTLVAVSRISLVVPAGTILGIVGPSGAGKTTTIRLLTGAIAADEGSVRVLGEDPARFRRRTRERIGYMPQLFTLYPDLTAGENVDFVASLFGLLFPRRRRRVRDVLRLVDLWEVRGRRAAALSAGMQRRLELACALVHDPALVFLDEPTAGIDPILRHRVWQELHRLRDAGRTLLVTTQYVNEAEECDQVALIARGRLVAIDDPESIRRAATGGELIEVETSRPFDARSLLGYDDVLAVDQRGPGHFLVTVEDAGTALTRIDDQVSAQGGETAAVREFRLSFDEVFARLVERAGAREGDGTSAEAAA